MEPKTKHIIKDRSQYLHLIPQAEVKTYVLKTTGAKLTDTMAFIKFVIPLMAYQTSRLAKVIGGNTPYNYCKAVFNWIYDHIEYRKDEPGKEQIKSPQRTIYDGYGDCDDMMGLACSLLLNKEIPFKIRTTVYDETVGVQHIYPYAVIGNRHIIIDCVAQKFDYEVPYLRKIDYELPYIKYNKKMELQFLNGTPEPRSSSPKRNIDAEDLTEGFSEDEIGDLGKKGKLKEKIHNTVKKAQVTANKINNSKAMQKVKLGVHKVNRVNPAAALLRAGILTSLKINMLKVAESLRFSYFTPEQAQARHLDMNKFQRLVAIRQRLEKIFYGAGGKIENFKASILKGRGNRDKQVALAGLGFIDFNDYTQQNSLRQILGFETYTSEVSEVSGFGELGIATEAAVAAATGVMTAIAALIKGIGSLKKNKDDKNNKAENQGAGSQTDNATNADPSNATDHSADNNATGQETNFPGADNSFNTNQTQNETDSGSDPQSNGGGAANKSTKHADTSAATNTAEGSTNTRNSGNEATTNSTGESDASNSSVHNSEGGENTDESSARGKANTAVAKTVVEEGVVTKVTNWAKENKLAATGVALLVVGGITFGLVKFFSKDKDKNHGKENKSGQGHALAGLPGKKKARYFHSDRFKVIHLK